MKAGSRLWQSLMSDFAGIDFAGENVEMERVENRLNPEQQRAVTHLDGPLLILAGAGSGKTRVLTNRIAWLIEKKNVAPWNILAITFTNKAAREMKDRVHRMVSDFPEAVHVATFHSTCVRILRRYIDRIGYQNSFDIYDTDDTRSLMKDVCRHMEINTKLYREKMLLAKISHLKEELIDPEQYRRDAIQTADESEILLANVYLEYQRRLEKCSALDFDDLISLTVRLFREHRDVLEYYQERWKYLMVDEYQDTNKAQFVFLSLLAQKYRNLCVVGDDDQSIYRFRGADIGNILNFEKIFPETEVIRLEQNYRSTQSILDCANSVIANNKGRKRKHLWTDRGVGDPVNVRRFDDARAEAKYIVDEIARKKRQGIFQYKDNAVLYRTNAQSRTLEEQLLYENVPYTIVGGTNFYARKEIKDVLAYLRLISNNSDDVAVKRIINVPKRGIGQTSINRVDAYANSHGMSFMDVAGMADKVPGIGRGGIRIREFVHLIREMRKNVDSVSPTELIRIVLDKSGYAEDLKQEGTEEARDRLENIGELLNKAALYETSFFRQEDASRGEEPEETDASRGEEPEETDVSRGGEPEETDASRGEEPEERDVSEELDIREPGRPTLQGFLEEVSLVADIDSFDGEQDRVVLMTLHSAKGLEFPNVYITGMDEGLFPSYHAVTSGDEADLEEERRLCYVGITRAMDHLTLTGARMRMIRGQMDWYRESRFLGELPRTADKELPREKSRSPYASEPKPWERPKKKIGGQKPFLLSEEPRSSPGDHGELGYSIGDTVRHIKFGIGVVREIREGGRDKEVTVEFERFGIKKMFAGFAKLSLVEEEQ